MRHRAGALRAAMAVLLLCLASASAAAAQQVVQIWPGRPPGTESWTGAEQAVDTELPNLGKVHIITNVTVPTLTIFRPRHATGIAMIVVPGGAFRALPWDLDGLETAKWLTAHGITAFVLKYRVRPPPSNAPPDRTFDDFVRRTQPAREIAVADAEQAVRWVRSHAGHFGVDRRRVGMIGFSAGAMTTVNVAVTAEADSRPDFAASLYGALLTHRPGPNAPPMFIVAAEDDPELPPTRSTAIFEAWTAARAPAELHLYEKGGHGFAFRAHHVPADRWPSAFEAWLTSHGWLAKAQRGAGSR